MIGALVDDRPEDAKIHMSNYFDNKAPQILNAQDAQPTTTPLTAEDENVAD